MEVSFGALSATEEDKQGKNKRVIRNRKVGFGVGIGEREREEVLGVEV